MGSLCDPRMMTQECFLYVMFSLCVQLFDVELVTIVIICSKTHCKSCKAVEAFPG